MADFSKQYCEIHDHGFPWDFDIEEIAEDLDHGYMNNIICEGFLCFPAKFFSFPKSKDNIF